MREFGLDTHVSMLVCFITIFSLGEFSVEVTATMNRAIKLLRKNLVEIGVQGPKELAQQIISAIQGSLVLSHTMQGNKVFKNCLKKLASECLASE